MFSDVAMTVGAEGEAHDPGEQAEARQGSHEHHPKPDEKVDFLVEEVDGQDALDRVALDVT